MFEQSPLMHNLVLVGKSTLGVLVGPRKITTEVGKTASYIQIRYERFELPICQKIFRVLLELRKPIFDRFPLTPRLG